MKTFSAALFPALALIALLHSSGVDAQTRRPISLPQVESMFQNVRATTNWNVDGELLWGYFFFDANPAKLRQAAQELEKEGYRIVDIAPVRDGRAYRLHVERV